MSSNLKLDWCSHEAAKYAVMRWHYSRAMPTGKLVKIGIWENKKFIGVVLFGRGACKSLGSNFGLDQTEVCELVRIAMDKHKVPVTKVMSIALKMLKKSNPGIRLVVSFADTNQDHFGVIYQAGNWIYAGKSAKAKFFKDKAGRIWHPRQVTSSGYVIEFGQARQCVNRKDCEEISRDGKHRYFYALDKSLKPSLEKWRKPHPKPEEPEQAPEQLPEPGHTDTKELISIIQSELSPDLLKKEYRHRNKSNPMFGHCYVASEALYYLVNEMEPDKYRPFHGKDKEGIVHWWLQNGVERLDPTAEQYTSQGKAPPYQVGRAGSFLTRNPSKRARILLQRVYNNSAYKALRRSASAYQPGEGGSIPTCTL